MVLTVIFEKLNTEELLKYDSDSDNIQSKYSNIKLKLVLKKLEAEFNFADWNITFSVFVNCKENFSQKNLII